MAKGIEAVLHLLFFLWISVRRFCSLCWIRFHKFLLQVGYLVKPSSSTFHKVVIIGDGFAEGVGDDLRPFTAVAGVSSRMESMCTLGNNIRHRWRVYNRGREGTSSHDWVPSLEPSKPSLLDRLLQSRLGDAEVFVVMIGAMDVVYNTHHMPTSAFNKDAYDFTEEDWADTTKNIRTICEHLRERGKRVCITDIPTEGASLGKHTGVVRRINRQINKYVKSSAAATPQESEKPPIALVKLSDYRVQRSDYRAYDGFHLNANGYTALALLMFDVLAVQMRAVEWRAWKGMLALQSKAPSSETQAKKDR